VTIVNNCRHLPSLRLGDDARRLLANLRAGGRHRVKTGNLPSGWRCGSDAGGAAIHRQGVSSDGRRRQATLAVSAENIAVTAGNNRL